MKRILLLILGLMCSLNGFSQESVNNFSVEGSEIKWQRVFEKDLSFNQLAILLNDSGLMNKVVLGENQITGELKPIDANFKGAGFSEMLTPMYIARSSFEAFVIIDQKEGKYRVTLKRIVLTQKFSDPLSELGQKSTIEQYGLKRGKSEFTSAFLKSPSQILDYTFFNKFDFSQTKKNDNW